MDGLPDVEAQPTCSKHAARLNLISCGAYGNFSGPLPAWNTSRSTLVCLARQITGSYTKINTMTVRVTTLCPHYKPSLVGLCGYQASDIANSFLYLRNMNKEWKILGSSVSIATSLLAGLSARSYILGGEEIFLCITVPRPVVRSTPLPDGENTETLRYLFINARILIHSISPNL